MVNQMKGELGLSQRGAFGILRTGLRARRAGQKGFTLIELMIVVSIILILISMAVPIYNQSIVRAREAVLRNNLFTMRSLINQYTMDKEKAPQSLEDLVSAGYLKQIPVDPFTGSRDTWVVDQEDVLMSVPPSPRQGRLIRGRRSSPPTSRWIRRPHRGR